jgi:hypothetical protein
MLSWLAARERSEYIEEQVRRALRAFTLGERRDEHEWIVRRHAANRWHEIYGGGS